MADLPTSTTIPGIKSFRLVEQQPVALMPNTGVNFGYKKLFFMEVSFADGSMVSVELHPRGYRELMARCQANAPMEHRVVAEGEVRKDGGTTPAEGIPLPVDRLVPLSEVEGALRRAAPTQPEIEVLPTDTSPLERR